MKISIDTGRWATVAITLALAFASGYLMQNVLSARSPDPEPDLSETAAGAHDVSIVVPSLRAPPVLPDRTREVRHIAGEPRLPNPAHDMRLAGR